MKQTNIFMACLMSLVLFSCKKDKTDVNDNNTAATSFTINGISDVTIDNYGTGMLGLEVRQAAGTQKIVNLSVTGLPDKITADFSSASGTPTFGSVLTFSADGATAGSYSVKIKGTTSDGSKEYDLKLLVKVAEDCTNGFIGIKGCKDVCSTEVGTDQHSSYTVTVEKAPGYKNRLNIEDFAQYGRTVYADLDCASGTLVIPYQESGLLAYEGTGTFTANKLTFSYKITDLAVPGGIGVVIRECTSVME